MKQGQLTTLVENFKLSESLDKYAVYVSWDDGDTESGPQVQSFVDIIDASSEEDACKKWKKEYGYQVKNKNTLFCFAELATDEQIAEDNALMEDFDSPISWNDLSSSDQTAVEFALPAIKKGASIKSAAFEACCRVSEGNAEPEYEDEDFYMEEPDFKKVVMFLQQEYGRE